MFKIMTGLGMVSLLQFLNTQTNMVNRVRG